MYGVKFFMSHGMQAFIALGGVVLALTGAEALYADMGHFGKKPIRMAWFGFVLPALVLNYFGQGALLMAQPTAVQNPFFILFPAWALYPMVALATAATVIASQATISGAYSLTKQAVQLGFLPRMTIVHTSAREVGQVYIPGINWILCLAVIASVIGFGTSSRLAGAYGHLSRLGGGIGGRGAGEQKLELDRRKIRDRIARLRRDLSKIEVARLVRRRGRRRHAQVAIAGYTNAGKTTLFNRLTRDAAFAADRLFATLDARAARAASARLSNVIFVDTVGSASLIDWVYSLNQPSSQQNISAMLGTPNPFNVNGAPFILNAGYQSVQFHGVLPRSIPSLCMHGSVISRA